MRNPGLVAWGRGQSCRGATRNTSSTQCVCTNAHTFNPERGLPKGELPEAHFLEARDYHGLQRLCKLLLGGLLCGHMDQDPGMKFIRVVQVYAENCSQGAADGYKKAVQGIWGYLVQHGLC